MIKFFHKTNVLLTAKHQSFLKEPSTLITIYTDGASDGNPGKSGAGVVIKTDNNAIEYSIPLPTVSNHEAEFAAIVHALEICSQKFPGEILSFRTDSKIVVDTFEKDYTKNEQFVPFLKKIRNYKKYFPYIFMKWIPTEKNKHADQLAKKALQNA